jgi:hypothetical protein
MHAPNIGLESALHKACFCWVGGGALGSRGFDLSSIDVNITASGALPRGGPVFMSGDFEDFQFPDEETIKITPVLSIFLDSTVDR